MKVFEEAMVSNIYDGSRLDEWTAHGAVKSKRSSRKMSNRSSSSSAAPAIFPPTSSSEFSGITASTEEVDVELEDLANCLLLLSQGQALDDKLAVLPKETNIHYKCKTCSMSFTSYQALGGHRTSHRKPEPIAVVVGRENMAEKVDYSKTSDNDIQFSSTSACNQKATEIPTMKFRVHDCSICGFEFSSGQALGGHMRRHRPKTSTQKIFSFDLNLPAPPSEPSDRSS